MKSYIEIRIVFCGDWEVLYIENDKCYEGHEIDVDLALFDYINSAIYNNGEIESIDFGRIEVTDEYMEDVGCPEDYREIPDNVLVD